MTNSENYDYLIIGGGIAGTSAAETIRSHDPNSSITILTEESDRLYSRVLLPHYLRNENSVESLYLRKLESYQEKNIQLRLKTRVDKVNFEKKTVETADGELLGYKKLLLATGGKVNKLSTPGNDLEGVVYLRTISDAQNIKEKISIGGEAVVLGGGFIGIEFAQSFIKNGLKTTAIIREKSFWETIVGENSGKLLSEILTSNGVRIISEAEVAEFLGEGKLTSLKLKNGEEVKATIAGVGIGIHLDLDYLKDSGLVMKKGVVTNEFLETSEPNVWAAGDITEFYDPLSKRYHLLGNWANASSQGRTVGINMASDKQAFETTSMYSINIFDSNFSFLGDPIVDSETQVIERGTVESKKLARILLREDIIVGASLINLPIERNSITKLIKNKIKITPFKEKLSNPNFDLSTIP